MPEDESRRIAERAIQYRSQLGAIAADGLMETFTKPPPRRSIGDWLDLNDYGYRLGVAAYFGFWGTAIVAAAVWWPAWFIAVPLLVLAFALCWWFG